MHNILMGLYPNPTYECCTLSSLQLNMEGGQLFFLTEGKCPHEWPGFCHQHLFYLEVVAVLMLIYPFHDMSCVIVGTKQYEEKSNFISLIGYGMYG